MSIVEYIGARELREMLAGYYAMLIDLPDNAAERERVSKWIDALDWHTQPILIQERR